MVIMKRMVRQTLRKMGYDISRVHYIPEFSVTDELRGHYLKYLHDHALDKAHYGCGRRLLGDGWLNVDMPAAFADTTNAYLQADLTSEHPFPSDFFKFAFTEDFLEHLEQPKSIMFLSESFRTLKPGGVLRLSFPGLRGVLRRHYRSSDYQGAAIGQHEAYTMWGHRHFYSEESLSAVARHIGFSNVESVEYGKSKYEDLSDLDSRSDQQDLNIYAELTK
jgi:predicted SAM-dependent methyltransferase